MDECRDTIKKALDDLSSIYGVSREDSYRQHQQTVQTLEQTIVALESQLQQTRAEKATVCQRTEYLEQEQKEFVDQTLLFRAQITDLSTRLEITTALHIDTQKRVDVLDSRLSAPERDSLELQIQEQKKKAVSRKLQIIEGAKQIREQQSINCILQARFESTHAAFKQEEVRHDETKRWCEDNRCDFQTQMDTLKKSLMQQEERCVETQNKLLVAQTCGKTTEQLYTMTTQTATDALQQKYANDKLSMLLQLQQQRCEALEARELARTSTAAAVGRTGEVQLLDVIRHYFDGLGDLVDIAQHGGGDAIFTITMDKMMIRILIESKSRLPTAKTVTSVPRTEIVKFIRDCSADGISAGFLCSRRPFAKTLEPVQHERSVLLSDVPLELQPVDELRIVQHFMRAIIKGAIWEQSQHTVLDDKTQIEDAFTDMAQHIKEFRVLQDSVAGSLQQLYITANTTRDISAMSTKLLALKSVNGNRASRILVGVPNTDRKTTKRQRGPE